MIGKSELGGGVGDMPVISRESRDDSRASGGVGSNPVTYPAYSKFAVVHSRISGRPGPNAASTTSDSLPTKTDRSRTARYRARCSIISAL